jgi:hypothetical protein
MALATIFRHPVRTVLFPPAPQPGKISPQDALLFFQKHNHPSQGLTLIEGNFDLALITRGLAHIFNTPSPQSPPLNFGEESLPSASRILRSHLPGQALAALAWRIPQGWSQAELEILALALKRAEVPGSEGISLRVLPSFPSLGRPSIFILEGRSLDPAGTSEGLLQHLKKRIDVLFRGKGEGEGLITKARNAWQAKNNAGFSPPMERLEKLGRSLLLGTFGTLPSTSKSLLTKAKELFQNKGQCTSLIDPIRSNEKESGK